MYLNMFLLKFELQGPSPRPPASPTPSPVLFGSTVSDLSLWLSPPTQPEVKTGGFLPNVGDQLSGNLSNKISFLFNKNFNSHNFFFAVELLFKNIYILA
jgi:hypothetical protein